MSGSGPKLGLPMPPLTPQQGRRSLAQRVASIADRVNQRVNVRLGMRPYRVCLTWTRWSGAERSEGRKEEVCRRIEILPTPRVGDLTAITYRTLGIGTVPEGSLRVDQISSVAYTADVLRGLAQEQGGTFTQPLPPPVPPRHGRDFPNEWDNRTDFFYEVFEDGRGDDPAERARFRLMSAPFRDPNDAQWVVLLQRASRDMERDGDPVQVRGLPPGMR